MYRADGYRVRTNDAMYELVPYIMPYRYDASNSVTVDIDLDLMQDYIRKCRKKGINMSHMSIIIAGALRIASQNPFLNRFVMNRKIYARNHFCVSFVTLQPGKTSDTVNKLYFSLDDDIFTVNRKVQEAIERTQQPTSQNALDKLMASLVRIPFLVGAAVGVLKFIDKYFTLPFSIINASPFHTSLFITKNKKDRAHWARSTVAHYAGLPPYANAFAPAALASAANLGSPNSGLCSSLRTIRVPVPYAQSSGGSIISAPDPLITLPFSSFS